MPAQDPPSDSTLSEHEVDEAVKRSTVRVHVVHEAIRLEGEAELKRSASALAWSGFAAGLSMGFSFIGEALLRAHLPDEPWRPIITKLGYSFGFVMVVLGRQQLFTENTLTPIIPLLERRDKETLFLVLRLWGVVLVANLMGAGGDLVGSGQHLGATAGNPPGFSADRHDIGKRPIRPGNPERSVRRLADCVHGVGAAAGGSWGACR